MSNLANITYGSESSFKLGAPGSPTYKGAVDYPSTIYQNYPGTPTYIWEPRQDGYPWIDHNKVIDPIQRNWSESFRYITPKFKDTRIYHGIIIIIILCIIII
jgi:hypothetical protein